MLRHEFFLKLSGMHLSIEDSGEVRAKGCEKHFDKLTMITDDLLFRAKRTMFAYLVCRAWI
jgi:hypothetical protein